MDVCSVCGEPLCPTCGGCYNLSCSAAVCSDPDEEHDNQDQEE